MDSNKYKLEIAQIRSELLYKGIREPIPEMVKRGLIKEDDSHYNFLYNNVISTEFLIQLKKLNNQIE